MRVFITGGAGFIGSHLADHYVNAGHTVTLLDNFSTGSKSNIAHLEGKVTTIDGVEYINDSKATNVDSVWYALESIKTPVIWIVGGVDKGNDYSVLMTFVNKKVKGIICLGKDNSKLQKQFGESGKLFHSTNSIADAVSKAKEWGVSGDTVLLSPACASFDLFQNYIDRGIQFKNIVHQLVTQS